MHALADHAGSWAGTGEFRLMPTDPFRGAPATAEVSHVAGGYLTTIAYTWVHPDDGPQHGFLALGSGEGAPGAVALWSDSWHQKPEARVLTGSFDGPVATLSYVYAGDWGWVIVVDAGAPDVLTLRMDNVVPASAVPDEALAGPFTAMSVQLRRLA